MTMTHIPRSNAKVNYLEIKIPEGGTLLMSSKWAVKLGADDLCEAATALEDAGYIEVELDGSLTSMEVPYLVTAKVEGRS